MDTNKAAYWIALGVLVLGLNSEYQHGRFVALHRVVERADSALCRITARAEQTLAFARAQKGREGVPVDDLVAEADVAEMTRAEGELLREQARDEAELLRDTVREQVSGEIRAQADAIRAQAEMRRAEVEQIKFGVRRQFRMARTVNRRVTAVCPTTGARIAVSAGPQSADLSSE